MDHLQKVIKESKGMGLLARYWPAIIGVLFVVLSIGWFLNYAFTNDWLSPLIRFMLILGGSVALMGIGLFLMYRGKAPGGFLVATGFAGGVLAFWMGLSLYGFFSVQTAFCGMVGLAFVTIAGAIIFNDKLLASVAVFIAMVIPWLTYSTVKDYTLLMSYVLLIDIVASVMLLYKVWGPPSLIACIATVAYNAIFEFLLADPSLPIFTLVFFFLFSIPWFFAIQRSEQKWQKTHVSAAIGLSFLLALTFLFIEVCFGTSENLSLALCSGAQFFAIHWLSKKPSLTIHQKFVAGLLGFSGFIYMTALFSSLISLFVSNYYVEMCLISVFIVFGLLYFRLIFKVRMATQLLSAFFLIPLSFASNWCLPLDYSLLSGKFGLLVTLLVSLGASFIILRSWKVDSASLIAYILFGFTVMDGLCIVWSLCYNVFPSPEIARGVTLALYTIASVIAYRSEVKFVRMTALIVLLGVIGRLLCFEVWLMPALPRMGTFLTVGILLIATAYFRSKNTKQPQSQIE